MLFNAGTFQGTGSSFWSWPLLARSRIYHNAFVAGSPDHRAKFRKFGSSEWPWARKWQKGELVMLSARIALCTLGCSWWIASRAIIRANLWFWSNHQFSSLFHCQYVAFFITPWNGGPGWHGPGWFSFRYVACSKAAYPTTRSNHINEDKQHRFQSVHESQLSMQIP